MSRSASSSRKDAAARRADREAACRGFESLLRYQHKARKSSDLEGFFFARHENLCRVYSDQVARISANFEGLRLTGRDMDAT